MGHAVPGGRRQPQTALSRVLVASWTPSQAPGKTGARGAGGTLGSWPWAAPGAQVTSRCHGSPVDHKTSEGSVARFSFLSFQLQLTSCID